MPNKLEMYVIYKNPNDHPGKWVMRVHDVPGGPRNTCFVGKSLEEARAAVPGGLIKLSRDPKDDPAIYEIWI